MPRRLRPLLALALLVVFAGVAFVAWPGLHGMSTESAGPSSEDEMPAAPTPSDGGLDAAPARPAVREGATSSAPAPAAEVEEAERKPLRLIARLDGDPSAELDLVADGAYGGGRPLVVSASPGQLVTVWTEDPRAAIRRWLVAVPDPLPESLVTVVPSASDPRLSPLVVEVVDAGTGARVSDAWMETEGNSWEGSEWLWAGKRLEFGREGRLRLEPDESAPWKKDPLHWLFSGHSTAQISAPGYGSLSPPVATADVVKSLLERGIARLSLPPVSSTWRTLEVRVLAVDGTPVPDTSVERRGTLAVIAGLLVRADTSGVATVSVPPSFALIVRVGRWPIGAWLMSTRGEESPIRREIRLPPLARMTVRLPADRNAVVVHEVDRAPMIDPLDREALLRDLKGAEGDERRMRAFFRTEAQLGLLFVRPPEREFQVVLPVGARQSFATSAPNGVDSTRFDVVGRDPPGPPIEVEADGPEHR